MNHRIQIGFSQRIQIEWLEYTTNLLLAGHTREQIKTALNGFLQDKLSVGSTSKRSNRDKAITILTRIWVTPTKELLPLRDEGLQLLKELPSKKRLAVHWGMCMAVYPFFGVVAGTVGRLLRLQGSFSSTQIYRRIREIYGQRDTINKPTQRVLRCFADWDLLSDTSTPGIYEANAPHPIDSPRLSAWLIEALLQSNEGKSLPLNTVLQAPQFFPFSITLPSRTAIEANPRLDVFRHAMDEEIVRLKF